MVADGASVDRIVWVSVGQKNQHTSGVVYHTREYCYLRKTSKLPWVPTLLSVVEKFGFRCCKACNGTALTGYSMVRGKWGRIAKWEGLGDDN